MEEWRPVVGYESTHEVSDHGRVRRTGLQITQRNRWGSTNTRTYPPKECKLTPIGEGGGYLIVGLGGQNHYIQSLVLTAFVGPRPEGMEACHNDGCRTNNALSNLRWDTRPGNHGDRWEHGTMNVAKLTVDQVREIRASKSRQVDLAAKYGVHKQTISNIKRRVSWAHVR